jgi:hypothetical protein
VRREAMSTKSAKKMRAKRALAAAEAAVSSIQMTFEGMMILFVRQGGPYCDVGILKYAPDHMANIVLTRIPELGAPETLLNLHDADFQSRMWLDVDKFEAAITLYENHSKPFRRANSDDPIDFRWALDLEGEEMYKFKIPVDSAGFMSVLRINDGTFYTQETSKNRLVKIPWKEPEVTLGKVAVKLRADITLTGESAYFQNGVNAKPLELKAEKKINYGIYVSHVRPQHSGGDAEAVSNEIDAENYNFAVAVDRPYNQKIHFNSTGKRTTPDAVCLTPTMSQTELSGS